MERSACQCPTKILLAEDNPLDVRLILYALRRDQTWLTEVIVVEDGEQAIEYLTQRHSSTHPTNPDLVILDLNLPKRDGTEVLQAIRTTEALRDLPVVVVSSSPEEISEGIVREANLEASGYIMKPTNVDDFLALGVVFRRILVQTCNGLRADGDSCQDEGSEDGTECREATAFRPREHDSVRSLVAGA